MTPGRWQEIKLRLEEAFALAPVDRADWLKRIGAADPDLSAEVESLLRAHDEQPEFLSEPCFDPHPWVGRVLGPYRLVEPIGEGGMGTVYKAVRADGLYERQVAIKLIRSGLTTEVFRRRFDNERQILARLHHPNIAQLLDAGFADGGQPYLTLEYVDGSPLTTYSDAGRLSIGERLQLFRQVLDAVQYAHAHAVIHRDLKPSNILVTAEGRARLLDFGIAKLQTEGQVQETELTQLGGRALTPDYAAPEQLVGAPMTTAVDVYALGAILFELLTGQRPHQLQRDSRTDPIAPSRATPTEEAAHARSTTAPRLAKSLRGDLDVMVTKAMKQSPGDRYVTVNALDEDIGRYLRGEAILAQRDKLAYRLVRVARRHRAGIATAFAVLLILIGGLVATGYEAKVAAAQRDAARQAQSRSLTQTAGSRLREGDVTGAMGILLEVLPLPGAQQRHEPDALDVFQQARAADAQIMVISGHTDAVQTAAFSPDGRHIVTASLDRTARVWDATTGRQVTLLGGHSDQVWSAAFSPDGKRIVTASLDGTARIWDPATGRQIRLLSGHTARVECAAFSSDQRVVTASFDGTARVWDVATGRQTLQLTGHTEPVVSAAFSPDARRIVTASLDGTVRIWDAASGRQLVLLAGRIGRPWSAAFSPDGARLVTASDDKIARIFAASTGRQIMQLSGHTGRLWSAAFSPDGRRIVTASLDQTARIWDAATGREMLRLSGHAGRLWSAAFSPDGERVVTASDDQTARVWDTAVHREVLLLGGHSDVVETGAYSPEGRRIVTASDDRSARIWDAATGRQLGLLSGHTDIVSSAVFSPDGRHVLTASDDRTARIWDVTTGRQLRVLTGHADLLEAARYSPDGLRIVTASDDKSARIWEAATGRQLLLLRGHADVVESAAFSPDAKRVVTASNDRTARIWDAFTGRQLTLLGGHADVVESAAFSPDGKRVVTASNDKTARIWDAFTGRQLTLLHGHSGAVIAATFSPDGRRIVTASFDATARVWDASTGQQLMLLSGHRDRVISAVFSPDGRRILTASDDRTARVWDSRAPAVDIQAGWAKAAQLAELSGAERFEWGLPAVVDARQWPADKSECDELAAAPYDPERRAAGAMLGQIASDVAVEACSRVNGRRGAQARTLYQRGRALMAGGNHAAARRDFEAAVAGGYRAAAIDLGILLSEPAVGMLDPPRAIALLETASRQGIAIAAFELGILHEHGVHTADNDPRSVLLPDAAKAWSWYQRAAESGEPHALARFAEQRRAAGSEAQGADRRTLLLDAFKYYAAAAERARLEDWPEHEWQNWSYSRASLARVLARAGMMEQVADAYAEVRRRYAAPPIWERMTARWSRCAGITAPCITGEWPLP